VQDIRLSTWTLVCSQILGRQLHVWSTFASTVFVGRVEVRFVDCIGQTLDCTSTSTHSSPLQPWLVSGYAFIISIVQNLRAVFGGLPEPNRACLVGVYAFLIWNNLCDLVYQTPTKSYQSQIPVDFGIPGHVTTKHLPDTPCYVLVGHRKQPFTSIGMGGMEMEGPEMVQVTLLRRNLTSSL